MADEESPKKSHVTVHVEYCGICDYGGHCLKLARQLREISEDFDVICKKGRQGTFEVMINDTKVYSKLKSKALPNYDEIIKRAVDASEGKPITPVPAQLPISCVIS